MSKFNKTVKTTQRSKPTVNMAGGNAFKMSKELELVTLLATSFVADQYYESSGDKLNRLQGLVRDINDKKFVAQAGLFARNELGMRSISHALAGEVARSVKGEQWTKNFFDRIVRRVDDMNEIVAYIWKDGKVSIPNSTKKGFRAAFDRFDNYQLSKYQKQKSEISLVDLVNLIHPVPTARNAQALQAIIAPNQKLVNTVTSQRALTEIGKVAKNATQAKKLRKDYWTQVIEEGKLGYTDLMRSLTKIAEEAPEAAEMAAQFISTESIVRKSLVMPFQLWLAVKMLEQHGNTRAHKVLKEGLYNAVDYSLANVPNFQGETLVVCDYSGSMNSPVNQGCSNQKLKNSMGNMQSREVGALLGVLFAKKNNADFMIFGSDAAYVPMRARDSVHSLMDEAMRHNQGYFNNTRNSINVGHGTSFESIFRKANKAYDRIIIFSDMQGWIGSSMSGLNSYKKRTGANPFLYSYDLRGHGSLQFPQEKTFVMAGFSEKVFPIMQALETDKRALLKKIKQIAI